MKWKERKILKVATKNFYFNDLHRYKMPANNDDDEAAFCEKKLSPYDESTNDKIRTHYPEEKGLLAI